jgi:hypothetical protein
MNRREGSILLAAILVVAGVFSAPAADGVSPDVDADANRILSEMGEYLKTAGEFSFRGDVAYDSVQSSGEKFEYGGVVHVYVRRPDRLRVVYDGDERKSRAFYDSRIFTLYDAAQNVYATKEVSLELDDALDRVFERFGLAVPIADLVYADPYAILIENVEVGIVVGRHPVDGIPCHHLAFSQEGIDWQIWIEDGPPRPVPRKLVITQKDDAGSPQYRARLSEWDFQPRLSDHYFTFRPPAGANEIEFLPLEETESEQ